MADIFAYAIGIMYTPGPINLLGLSSGLNKQTRSHLGFLSAWVARCLSYLCCLATLACK